MASILTYGRKPDQTRPSSKPWSRFRMMTSTAEKDLADFVVVLRAGLSDKEIRANRDFSLCMGAYLSRNDVLDKLRRLPAYGSLLLDPDCFYGLVILFDDSLTLFSEALRLLEELYISDPEVRQHVKEALQKWDNEARPNTRRLSDATLTTETQQTTAATLGAGNQNDRPDNQAEPAEQDSASAKTANIISNEPMTGKRGETSEKLQKSSERQQESSIYQRHLPTRPSTQTAKPPASSQQRPIPQEQTNSTDVGVFK